MPNRYQFAVNFHVYATVTHLTEGAKTEADLLSGRNLTPVVVVHTDVGKVTTFADKDRNGDRLPVVYMLDAQVFVMCRREDYIIYSSCNGHEDLGPIKVAGLSFHDAVARTKASTQSMTLNYVVTKLEDSDNFEEQTPAMVRSPPPWKIKQEVFKEGGWVG